MSDPDIFAAGVGVTFIFLAGVYVVLRERFRQHEEAAEEVDADTEDGRSPNR